MSSRYAILLGKLRKPYKSGSKIFREGYVTEDMARDHPLKLDPSVCHLCEYPGMSDSVGFVCKCGIAWKYLDDMTREQWNEWYGV